MSINNPAGTTANTSIRLRHGVSLLCALLCLTVFAAHADLALQRVITLPDVRGQFGQLALDPAGGRLFVAVTGSNRLLAVDLKQDRITGQVTGLDGPQGVIYLPDDWVAISGSGSGVISFYTATALALRGSLIFGADAGALCFDPDAKRLYFGYGREQRAGIAEIGTDGKPLAQLSVPDQPEGMVVDPSQHRLYAGFGELNSIAVFDLAAGKQLANWSLGEGENASYPLALDADGKRLFVGGRSGDEMAVLDTQSGKLLQNIAAPGEITTLSFDPHNRELYAPGGIGQLAIYSEGADGLLHVVGRMPTRRGAHSGVLDTDSGRYYLAVPASAGKPAEIRVYLVIDQTADATPPE